MADMIEKRELLNELFDLYGAMLTEKQKNYFILYYQEDFSLAEIAEEEDISRNAVYDNLKRTENILTSMEEKLGFLKRIEVTRADLYKIASVLQEIQETEDYDQLDTIKTYIEEIADNI
ncbi:MAG: YlxM family DNA-binding protein [Eubacteriales bacterium]|jgi:predicted DNA-binding protein YlxM (UPF0122 family)|nr:YlxM family DNA-binding protein [Eubacteriales bacterium]